VRHALAIAALVVLLPGGAMAQPAVTGTDVDAAQAEVDRDYAAAQAADCATACLALESLRRATDHLCAIDPGDRCARARQKLADATTRVTSSCPACGEHLADQPGTAATPPPPPPSPTSANVAEEAQVSKRGGCAGCATTGSAGGAFAPLAAVGLALLALRRRRPR
jgi:MYXO-CTERM domain-containing protein